MPHRSRRRAAFTLMEVLLVLAILVILGSLVAMSFTNVMGDAYRSAAKAQVSNFESAIKLYYLHLKQYPATGTGLTALTTAPGDLANPAKWKGPYLEKAIPADPWGRPYQYATPGRHNPQSFDVWSLGADGVDGTEDDVGNWAQP